MNEREFLEKIDCNFPYNERKQCLNLIAQAAEISENAVFSVLHEICRPPKSASVNHAILNDLLKEVESKLKHPLGGLLITLARKIINDEEITPTEQSKAFSKIEKFPGEYSALSIAYFASSSDSDEADKEYDKIQENWKSQDLK